MPARIDRSAGFHRMLDGLANDIIDAGVHLRLYRDLREAIPEFRREFNQTPAFWTLTLAAQIDAVFARLIRAYDQHPAALSLEMFMDRLIEMAPLGNPPIETSPLVADRSTISSSDALVLKLVKFRGHVIAHRNALNVIEVRNLEARFGLSVDELQTLVDRGTNILNRYASLFAGASWSSEMVGRDDYKTVLKAVREMCDQHEREIERELADSRPGSAT